MDKPLAYRMKPKSLEEFFGQEHIVGKDKLLYRLIKADRLTSIILWGPPGCGKTSLAKVIANTTQYNFVELNATSAGVSDINKIDIVNNYIYVKDLKTLNKWLNKEMDRVFQEHYNFWLANFTEHIPHYRLRYRTMKTRWGVCNKKSKTITLNTNLIKYDMCCLDYVIVHELSHLVHFDHSSNFWKLVEKNYPNYKIVRKMLK